MSEGVIKFAITNWDIKSNISEELINDIEIYRKKFYDLKLIGFDNELKLGYGNISKRVNDKDFVISGTQTGHLSNLSVKEYCVVNDVDFNTNSIKCSGFIKPSSESITHGAFYFSNKEINSVLHIHDELMWNKLINENYPSTPKEIEYGSIELSKYIINFFKNIVLKRALVIVLKGHKDGVFFAGDNFNDVYNLLMELKNE